MKTKVKLTLLMEIKGLQYRIKRGDNLRAKAFYLKKTQQQVKNS